MPFRRHFLAKWALVAPECDNHPSGYRGDIGVAQLPPPMMEIMPNNVGGFSDMEKAAKVYFNNEIKYLQ